MQQHATTWIQPGLNLESVLIQTPKRSLAFKVQSFLFSEHKIRSAFKPNDELWSLEYHPLPDSPTIEQARAIAVAYLTAIDAIRIPTKGQFNAKPAKTKR